MNSNFNTLIVITPPDCKRLVSLYPRLIDNIKYGQIYFVGTPRVGELVLNDPGLAGKVGAIDENDIIQFEDVHRCIAERMKEILAGRELPRGITGWYYQQFLKMQYSYMCKDRYYMVWDGDTIPCRPLTMFQEGTGKPYLDLKHEYHQEYFETMGRILPGFHKVIERSFISEHMLFRADIMRKLIDDIERNDLIPGTKFWEKIINSIDPAKIQSSSFSEFETYGTYVALRHPDVYALREWHSFRQGGTFYSIDTICDRDFEWLSKDFGAISFEKGHTVREDNANLFDNPYYQEKLTPKQMLQAAQMEYKEGYKEVWADEENYSQANIHDGEFVNPDGTVKKNIDEGNIEDSLNTRNTGKLLTDLRNLLENNPAFLDEMPIREIISCVYVEIYGLRQLYAEEHFQKLENRLSKYSEILESSRVTGDVRQAIDIIDSLIALWEILPDADVSQYYIEKSNFSRALLRHQKETTVLVIGDSHVNFFSGNERMALIPIGNEVNTCEQVNDLPLTVLHMGPCLAYKSNQYGSTMRFREKLDWLLDCFIEKGDRIICVLGETDIRAHVFKQAEIQNKSYKQIIDNVVKNYGEFLVWLRDNGYEVYCYGPIASQKDSSPVTSEYPRFGSEHDRNLATEYFTERMGMFCLENEMSFMSLFDEMITENYETRKEFLSDDEFHLGQYAADRLKVMLEAVGLL